jgi:hypothetical protein
MNFFKHTSSSAILLSAFLISSCGGSGGGDGGGAAGVSFAGNTSPAAIDADNAEAIGTAAGEAIQIANASTGLPAGIAVNDNLTEINNAIISQLDVFMLPAGIDMSSELCSPGSGTASTTDPGSAQSGPVNITITFNNCELTGTAITVNGTASMHINDIANIDAGFSITYTNFKVTDINGTTTINMSMVCTSASACTFNSDFMGTDGTIHRVSEFSVYGNATDGFNGSATFYHGSFGSVDITASNITYGNCGSYPDGGMITYDSTDGTSGTIAFASDCSVTGTWNDGVASGSF